MLSGTDQVCYLRDPQSFAPSHDEGADTGVTTQCPDLSLLYDSESTQGLCRDYEGIICGSRL